ncbi:MAG: hypothetical protein HYT72_01425 [Candidatus Aenigmarchaeota archaeon]|nr:hypothetical protein [Candidatus Aenigmarchaeota archaeon]
MDTKLISVAIISALIGVIAFMGFQLYGTPTGKATASGPYQGFATYEEMMQAHHGNQVQDTGCGMESGPSASQFATGELTDYGVTLDNSGYEQLLNANALKLSAEQTKKIVGLDIQIPCCGFQKIQASGNCECGHHIALVGLAKLLALKGYERDAIQQQLDIWKNIFYPNGVESGAGACG